jgi:ribosome biogenesis GTPase A
MNIELTLAIVFILFQAMSKLVAAEWQKYLASMGIRIPRLAASKSRKLTITIHRKGEATKEQQVALAQHMAHTVGTADRY